MKGEKRLKTLERYKKELIKLEKQRDIIDEKKRALWKQIKSKKTFIADAERALWISKI